MHIFFSGIGGTAIGPLALIAKQAGLEVSGSDKQASAYTEYLAKRGLSFYIGQSKAQIERLHQDKPIDWYVYSSAVAMEQRQPEELLFCQENAIKTSKRDELINYILEQKNQKMIAIAGTHGKTTTTAMVIWLLQQLQIPLSYSIGAKLPFGDMGHFDETATYFVYEADEYDRNFLSFSPEMSIISGVDYDHPDIYPTREEYNQAFRQFLQQSNHAYIWSEDAERIHSSSPSNTTTVIDKQEYPFSKLTGQVNRENAAIAAQAIMKLLKKDSLTELITILDSFPGLSRRFEQIAENLYSDYAHTPAKIKGALQIAKEVAGDNVIVIYEGLHNTRQHFIKDELPSLFNGAKKVYVVPSYRAREDESLEDLTPEKIANIIAEATSEPAQLDHSLEQTINQHRQAGDLVLCLSAGGGASLDEWLRQTFIV